MLNILKLFMFLKSKFNLLSFIFSFKTLVRDGVKVPDFKNVTIFILATVLLLIVIGGVKKNFEKNVFSKKVILYEDLNYSDYQIKFKNQIVSLKTIIESYFKNVDKKHD